MGSDVSQVDFVLMRVLDLRRAGVRRDLDVIMLVAEALADAHSYERGTPTPEIITQAATACRLNVSERMAEHLRSELGGVENSADLRRAFWMRVLDGHFGTRNDGLGELFSTGSTARLAATALSFSPDEIPDEPVVWDPCAGSGRVLVEVANALAELGKRPRLAAWDRNEEALALAATACFLWDHPFNTRSDNSLLWDAEADPFRADIAVSDPPMSMDWQRMEEEVKRLESEGGFPWGSPSPRDASWLFAQLMWKGLSRSGKAVHFTTRAPLIQDPDIGESAVRDDALHSVIVLPEGTSPVSQIHRYAVLFDRDKPQSRASKVSFIDLRDFFEESPKGSRSPRTLTEDAYDAVRKGLTSVRPTRVSRTADAKDLMIQTLQVRYPRLNDEARRTGTQFAAVASVDYKDWGGERYGSAGDAEVSPGGDARIDLTGEFVFPRSNQKIDLKRYIRLSCVLTSMRIRVSKTQSHRQRNAFGVERDEPWIVVRAGRVNIEDEAPEIGTIGDAVSDGGSWHFAFQVDPSYDPAFVVSFLDWKYGQLPLRRPGKFGLPSLSVRVILNHLDEVAIPKATGDEQSTILASLDALRAVDSKRKADLDDVWTNEASSGDVRDRARGYVGSTSVGDRLRKWPNPIASAAWNIEINRAELKAYEHSLVQFWEAVAAFHASILLSALKSIPDLEQHSLESIRSGIARTEHLSLSEASMGAYSLITTTTASMIRSRLPRGDGGSGKDEEKAALAEATQAQIQTAFGGLNFSHINTLVSKELANIFERLRPLRTVGVHGGMETKAQLQDRTEKMNDLINEWDALTRSLWLETLLVRGGPSDRFDDHWQQEVEVAIGNDYPFAKQKVRVGDAMKSGSLCLYVKSAENFMELSAALFHFMEVPDDNKFACYFFNRMSANELDLKSLVYPSPVHGGLDVSPEISGTVRWLIGEQADGAL